MDRIIDGIIARRKAVVAAFLTVAVVCAAMIPFVGVNYDMVDYLPKWYRIDELVDIVQFVGVQRPRYKAGTSYPVIWVDVPLMDISSSMVRDFIAQGRKPNFLLPQPVLDYIEKEGLY